MIMRQLQLALAKYVMYSLCPIMSVAMVATLFLSQSIILAVHPNTTLLILEANIRAGVSKLTYPVRSF